MRLKIFLFGLIACCFSTATVQAQTEKTALKKPQELTKASFADTIAVSDDESMRFVKNPQAELFQALKADEQIIGYAQAYLNPLCFATVSFFYPNLGRLSNAKIKRYLKEETAFQITHQNSTRLDNIRLHYMAGAQKDQTDVLMATDLKDNILQVRTTCQTIPSLNAKENRKRAVFWSKEIARETIENLKNR